MYISVLSCWIREWNRFWYSVKDTWKSPFWLYLNTKYHVMSKYHHAPKQAWQTGVLIKCRYGLSGVILFIFHIILITCIWIYYTITFCRFTFCFYILMAKQANRRKPSVFNETHLQKIVFENWRTTKLCEKQERTSEQCHEFVTKIKIGLYYGTKLF